MIFRQKWQCARKSENIFFDANVPGNVQKDYAAFMGWGDINYADNCLAYIDIEDDTWVYRTKLCYEKKQNERVYLVGGGIDYIYSIFLGGKLIFKNEGMFSPIELDLTDILEENQAVLEIEIAPHPKREGAVPGRDWADQSTKPPVCYGWDWHPRVIVSGIWEDLYIETKIPEETVSSCEVFYTLSEDFAASTVEFKIVSEAEDWKIDFVSPSGEIVYSGYDRTFTVDNPMLWWCNGQGEPNLYTWHITRGEKEYSGRVGFRKVLLVMNDGAWEDPACFPKSRSNPPITICLNGRNIFAKGSNFLGPEIFTGTMTRETYLPLVTLAREANMNIFRLWGGCGIQKQAFYDLCDEMGIMVWQEFPLACNNYIGTDNYLKVLEKEATAIVRKLRHHASLVLWCGGNELFNRWSKMTDQSLALRLLNKICYEEDRNIPFIATSPLAGMAHGGYMFYYEDDDQTVYDCFNNSNCTAYTEFGVPSVAPKEYLQTFLPEEILENPMPATPWETHHAYNSWVADSWLCEGVMLKYFGKWNSIDQLCEWSAWTQCEGYKAAFEEARRQKPHCSMAINWCYNEPWKTAANNSIICYPCIPKPSYYAVKNSLEAVVPSARLKRFDYESGDLFTAELWLLNDSQCEVNDVITATITLGDREYFLLEWHTDDVPANENKRGHMLQFVLPEVDADCFVLNLRSKKSGNNSYKLKYRRVIKEKEVIGMNM